MSNDMETNLEEENLKVYTLHNPFPKDFMFPYGKRPWIIKGNSSAAFSAPVAKHGAKKLIDKWIEIKHDFTRINDKALRAKCLEMILPNQNVSLEDIENVPVVKTKSLETEGLIESQPEAPIEQQTAQILGENFGGENLDGEIDLNPGQTVNPQEFTEEQLKQEALKDSDPIKFRAMELEKMDWNELRILAKSKEVEGKNRVELVKGMLKIEYPTATFN